MISELLVNNFKGFSGPHKIKLAPLTLIYGSNSSGKSALLKALAVINQSTPKSPFEAFRSSGVSFNFYGTPVDLGGFTNSIFKQDSTKTLSLGIKSKFLYRPMSRLVMGLIDNVEYSVDFKWNRRVNDSETHSIRIKINLNNDDSFELFFKKTPQVKIVDNEIGTDRNHLELILDEADAELIANYIVSTAEFFVNNPTPPNRHGREPRNRDLESFKEILNYDAEIIKQDLLQIHSENPILFRVNGFILTQVIDPRISEGLRVKDNIFYSFILDLIEDVRSTIRREISGISYIGPMRALPERMEQDIPDADSRNKSDGSDLVSILANDDGLVSEVNSWLEKLSIPYSIKIGKVTLQDDMPSFGKYRSLILIDKRTNTSLSAKDLGFGISQILPVILTCLDKKKSLILIEQPELHIHPKLQLEIAELFVHSIKSREQRQLIIETHSENLILRIQKKIREGQLSSDQVSIIFVGSENETGSWVKHIPILPSGELAEEWPGGFFTERIDEW